MTDAPRRTAPVGLAVDALAGARRSAIPAAAGFFALRNELSGLGLVAAIILLVIALNLVISFLKWQRFTFTTGENDIRVESGIVSRAARSVPYERIQDVSLEQKLLPRIFGLVEVRFETGAGGKDELKLSYLPESEGEALRRLVRARREQGVEDIAADDSENAAADAEGEDDAITLFRMDERRLFTFGLFEFSLAVFAVLGAAAQYAETFGSIEIWDPDLWRGLAEEQSAKLSGLGPVAQIISAMAGLMVLVAIGSATGLVRTFLRDWGFVLEKTSRGFRRRRGLFTRTDVVMPQHRVQAIKIATGPIRNRFGWKSLKFVSLAQDSGSANHMVAPFAQSEETTPIIQAAGFRPPSEALEWHRTSKRYRLDSTLFDATIFLLAAIPVAIFAPTGFVLIPLALALGAAVTNFYKWKFHRHALDQGQIFSTLGLFAPKTQIASRVKLHSVELSQGPIAQRRGYATLHLGLAGGIFAIPGVELGHAREMRQAILTSIAARDFSQLT